MSLSSPALGSPLERPTFHLPAPPAVTFLEAPITWVRGRWFSDSHRTIQTWLGLIWLLDGALQFQSFMYGPGFISSLKASGVGQPPWLADSVNWAASIIQSQQVLFNTLFAVVQIAIGLGLLHRRTVRSALALSFVWALMIWWLGEGFGMLFMGMANPLSGAPGAAVLYLLVGLIAWPSGRPGGLLGIRGARLSWGVLWATMAWLWLTASGSSPNGVSETINGAPSGVGSLTHVQIWLTTATEGKGLAIGVTLAMASAAIGMAVARNWHARAFLRLAIGINLTFWIVGQGLGGIFAGGATDPNSAPLFVLLACALYALVPLSSDQDAARRADGDLRRLAGGRANRAVSPADR